MYKIIGADGKEYGPVSLEVLRQWIAEGRANSQTRVQGEGEADWKTIVDVPELASALSSQTIPPIAPAPIAPPVRPRNNSNATAGLTLGILAVTFGICCCYGLPFSIPGIICSTMALSQMDKDPAAQQGRGMAMTGLVLSILSLLMGALMFSLFHGMRSGQMFRHFHRF